AGETCGAAGHCMATSAQGGQPGSGGTGGGGTGGGGGAIEPTRSCGGEAFQSSPVDANFLILFDKSGSMKELVGGVAKWTAAVQAVNKLAADQATKIRFGLTLFPLGTAGTEECTPAPMSVPIRDNNAPAIASALAAVMPGGKTPLGA